MPGPDDPTTPSRRVVRPSRILRHLGQQPINFTPPKQVQSEIRRRARQYMRLGEREEEWIPLPAVVFPIAAIGSMFGFVMVGILLVLVMLGSLPDLSSSYLLQSSWLQEPANKPWADFFVGLGDFFGRFGFLRIVGHIFAWCCLILGISFYVNGARDLWLLSATRDQIWREAVLYEYASNRLGRSQARPPMQHIAGVASILGGIRWRWFLRHWPGVRRGEPDERLRHARRWARLDELNPLLENLGAIFTGFVCITVLLWYHRILATSEHFSWAGAVLAAAAEYSWGMAKAIPILEIPETLGWKAPSVFAQDTLQRVLLLMFKVAIVAPILAYITHIFRHTRADPREELDKGKDPLSVIAQLLAHRGIPDEVPMPTWRALHEEAAQILNNNRVANPGGTTWTSVDVYRAIKGSSS